MAAVEYYDFVACFGGVGQSEHLAQRKAIVTGSAIACKKVPTSCLDVTMAGEVKERRIAVACEQLANELFQVRPRYYVIRSNTTEHLYAEIHRSIAVPFKNTLHRVRIGDASM